MLIIAKEGIENGCRIFMSQIPSHIKYIAGVDEVGRGPLAGPFAVGVVLMKIERSTRSTSESGTKEIMKGVRDSKQLTPIGRALWFEKIRKASQEEKLNYKVSFVSSRRLDEIGLTATAHVAIKRSLKKLGAVPRETLVLLDGGLRAPKEFIYQKTIIKGDEKEPVIGMASIMAKVLRDKRMEKLALKYPQFDFHIHKGYGTKHHISLIKKFGPCEIHRRSFIKNIV